MMNRSISITNPVEEAGTSPLYAGAALTGIGMVSISFLAPLYHTVQVLGGTVAFILVVAAALGLALILGRTLSNLLALTLAGMLLAAGLGVYLLSVPPGYWEVLSVPRLIADMIALLTGYSILQMTSAGVWAIGVAPAPTFLVWFFALRGEYVRSATLAALVLGFFVLTGDAGTLATLFGVIGIAGTVAFHTLDRHGGSRRQAEVLAASLALMILASTAVTAVPGGGASPLVPGGGGAVQGSLVDAKDRQAIQGSLRLSPKVHFVVEAEQARYWRVAAYDRFTGREWVRTGTTDPVTGELNRPPGPRETLFQQITAKTALQALPAAAKGIRVTGVEATVSDQGLLKPASTIAAGESFGVVSSITTATPAQLRNASTNYPSGLSDTYFELPESTSGRVANLTENITAGANNPYQAAKAIEQWLESNKRYSLNVQRPEGNIAEKFLFEMNEGYCVYYASAMVMMLRSQGIPARYVTGYTSGQQVSADTFVVRGLDSHAWVEVYFPGYGWTKFDPTPALPRTFEEGERLEQAREQGIPGVDAAGSDEGTWTPTATPTPTTNASTVNGTPNGSVNGTSQIPGIDQGTFDPGDVQVQDPADQRTLPSGETPEESSEPPKLPAPPETLALWGLLAVGLVAGARRSGAADRVYRSIWLGYQPAADPEAEVRGAFGRVLYLLERRYRDREQGETVREYLDSIGADDAAREVAELRERCVHAGRVTEADGERARELARQYIKTHAGTAATLFNRLLS